MTVQDLIHELQVMRPDAKVFFWVGDERQEIVEVRDVGDCVDLYEEDLT